MATGNEDGLFRRKFYSKEELFRNRMDKNEQNDNNDKQTCPKCGLSCEDVQSHLDVCTSLNAVTPGTISGSTNPARETSEGRPGELKCPDCGKKFAKNIHLTLHMKIHARMGKSPVVKSVTKNFACNFCELRFENNNELINHFKATHYSSLIEDFSSRDAAESTVQLTSSTWNHSATDVLKREKDSGKCDSREKTFTSVENPLPLQSVTPPLNHNPKLNQNDSDSKKLVLLECTKCGRSFERQNQLNFHTKLCRASKRSTRDSVETVDNEKSEKNDSLKDCVQIERGDFVCRSCGQSYFSQAGLSQHIAKIHRKQQLNFRCDDCGRLFKHQHYLNFHMRSHYKLCKSCGAKVAEHAYNEHLQTCVSTNSSLNSVVNEAPAFIGLTTPKHSTSEKLKICEICGQLCINDTELSQHCLVHAFGTDVYTSTLSRDFQFSLPFLCEYFSCGRRFSDPPDLAYHISDTHLEANLFCCEVCGKNFSLESDMMSHRSAMHNLKKSRETFLHIDIMNTEYVLDAQISKPTYYNLSHRHNQLPDPYVLFGRDMKLAADKLLAKQSHLTIKTNASSRDRMKAKPVPKILKGRALKKTRGRKPREDIPYQNFYVCEHCDKRFQKRQLYMIHIAYHFPKFACKLCDRKFHARVTLEAHMKRHADPNFNPRIRASRRSDIPLQAVYTCSKCPDKRTYTDRHRYIMHLHYHNMKRLKCRFCDRTFVTKRLLLAHMEKHSDPNFLNHRRGRAGNQNVPIQDVYSCKQCADTRTFTDRNKYLIHMRYHNLEKKYECSLCPRRFKVEQSLKSHLQTHASIKRFKCEDCLKMFQTKQNLNLHKKNCKKIPCKFKCKLCNDMFHNKLTLARHIGKYHSQSVANKPLMCEPIIEYPCPKCSQTFNTTFGLSRHVSIYHPSAPITINQDEPPYSPDVNFDNYCPEVPEASDGDSRHSNFEEKDAYDQPDVDITDMMAVSFCETQLTDEPVQAPTKLRRGRKPNGPKDPKLPKPPKVSNVCQCGSIKKYVSQKFCHISKCPCVNAGRRCGSSCRCKDACLNKNDCHDEQQRKFREGRENMIQDLAANSNYQTSQHQMASSSIKTYAAIQPYNRLSSGYQQTTSVDRNNIIQSEFISLDNTIEDESLRQLSLAGYVEGNDDLDPLADKSDSAPEVLVSQDTQQENQVLPGTSKSSSSATNFPNFDGISTTLSNFQLSPSSVLSCQFCINKTFKLMPAYISHVLLHAFETSTFRCPVCYDYFSPVLSFARHLDSHNKGVNLQCIRCTSKFKSSEDMQKHLKVHHFRPMECGQCLVKFSDAHLMMSHWSQKHPTCQCGLCMVKFFSYEDLTHHMKCIHSPYDCLHCSMRFEKLDGLLDHFTQAHYQSTSAQALEDDGVDFNLEDLRCEECGDVFRSVDALGEHLNKHIQDNLRGSVASATDFNSLYGVGSLAEENNIQAVETLTCPRCDKTFRHRGGWIQHLCYLHKLSVCSSCYLAVDGQEELDKHFRTSLCKVYICSKCPRNFKRPANLSQHLRVVHSGNVDKRAIQSKNNLLKSNYKTPFIVASKSLAPAPQPQFVNLSQISSSYAKDGEIEEIVLE